MNELLNDLIRQAIQQVGPEDRASKEATLQRYGELIVRECCDMVNKHLQHNNPHDCILVLDIKDHFGIE